MEGGHRLPSGIDTNVAITIVIELFECDGVVIRSCSSLAVDLCGRQHTWE